MAQKNTSTSFEIKTTHKQAFREIFNLIAKDTGKINRDGLRELFKTIGYQVTEEQFQEMVDKIFKGSEWIMFDNFLEIFNLKLTDYTTADVTNAFKLLAKDDDKYITLDKIKKILQKNGLTEKDVNFLITQLEPFTDQQKRVDYKQFLDSLTKTDK